MSMIQFQMHYIKTQTEDIEKPAMNQTFCEDIITTATHLSTHTFVTANTVYVNNLYNNSSAGNFRCLILDSGTHMILSFLHLNNNLVKHILLHYIHISPVYKTHF